MDAEKGLTILVDDKDVNGTTPKSRFNWDTTDLPGIARHRLHRRRDQGRHADPVGQQPDRGPGPGDDGQAHRLRRPRRRSCRRRIRPRPEGRRSSTSTAMANKHPRLLFTADKIAQLKAFYNSPEGKIYRRSDGRIPGRLHGAGDRKMSPAWGQEYGLFKMPMVALHYVLTKDQRFVREVGGVPEMAGRGGRLDRGRRAGRGRHAGGLCQGAGEDEASGAPRPSGTATRPPRSPWSAPRSPGTGCTTIWTRRSARQFRQMLWQHARVMYYGGHKGGNPEGGYWRGMPAIITAGSATGA